MASSSAMETLRERIAKMKEMLGDWPCEDDTEASWVEHTVGEIQVQRSFLETRDKFFKEKFTGLKVEIQSLMNDFEGVLQSYGEDIAVLKKAVLQGCSSSPEAPPKVQVLKPKGFNGNMNTKELENFLWDMEQFFRATHVLDDEKVSITNMYLTGDDKLWWRTRMRMMQSLKGLKSPLGRL